jgi:hypothetical protein
MADSILHELPGGKALFDWFGRKPRFHDAQLLEITFSTGGQGLMRIHAFNMTNEVDAQGYFVLDKHVAVTLALEGVSQIGCSDFHMAPGIIFDLEITKEGEQFRIEWGLQLWGEWLCRGQACGDIASPQQARISIELRPRSCDFWGSCPCWQTPHFRL